MEWDKESRWIWQCDKGITKEKGPCHQQLAAPSGRRTHIYQPCPCFLPLTLFYRNRASPGLRVQSRASQTQKSTTRQDHSAVTMLFLPMLAFPQEFPQMCVYSAKPLTSFYIRPPLGRDSNSRRNNTLFLPSRNKAGRNKEAIIILMWSKANKKVLEGGTK